MHVGFGHAQLPDQAWQCTSMVACAHKGLELLVLPRTGRCELRSIGSNVTCSTASSPHHRWLAPSSQQDAFIDALGNCLHNQRAPASVLAYAARNLRALFQIAWQFGPPEVMPQQELIKEIDMQLSIDLLGQIGGMASALGPAPEPQQPRRRPQMLHTKAEAENASVGPGDSKPQMQQQPAAKHSKPAAGSAPSRGTHEPSEVVDLMDADD